jgi:hypothetical protein
VLSCHHGDQPQTNNISLLGENLYFGAVSGRLIHFNPMTNPPMDIMYIKISKQF